MLFLNEHDLKKCLDYDELRVHMKHALQSFSLKKATNFPRAVFNTHADINAPIGFMPAVDHGNKLLGYKAISVFHHNHKMNLNPHQGIVVLLDKLTGQVKCILDGFFVTAVRTAAVSAVSTELLSRADSKTLALIGAGCQAVEHVKAISRVRSIERVIVYSRTTKTFDDFSKKLSEYPFQIETKATPQEAVASADIIVTCTSSSNSLLSIHDFPKGAHINAVGACRPGEQEITICNRDKLKIYLDSEEACMIESEEIIHGLKNLSLDKKTIIGELGTCLSNHIPGRESQDEITFFKSVGLSIEDVYAADCFYQKAQKINIGQHVNL
ncbi:MAG: ornithine cyclodeaminase family protein [Legionellaceae bacterium]|nr:ornithine cyclodeaminase family protein [Legionellaceae bacterium]